MNDNNDTQKTITDFGEQWVHFTLNSGYYGSQDVLRDILGPFYDSKLFTNKVICDIGAGTGRITNLLIQENAKQVIAIEPSISYDVLLKNTLQFKDKILYLNVSGNAIPESITCDIILSIGVIHHIPDPLLVLRNAHSVLKEGGLLIIWVYGAEGNELYLSFTKILRKITIKLPHKILLSLSKLLLYPLKLYCLLCNHLNLPMRDYMSNHISRLDNDALLITIYDQLNPTYAKYYTKNEAIQLLKDSGFVNIEIYHRHSYSYTVKGEKLNSLL